MDANMEQKSHKWAEVFVEIALRAIRRVHYEYGIWGWGIGRQLEMDRQDIKEINMGKGIELADEPAVCAAITQEFMRSPSVAGVWKDNGQTEEMYFIIEREKAYEFNNLQRADIFLQKFKYKDKGGLNPVPRPSFIEAKRAHLWSTNLSIGKTRIPRSQHGDVQDDIKKLRKEMSHRDLESLSKRYYHILVWGVYEKNSTTLCSPEEFFKKVDDPNIQLHKLVKWLPLVWNVSEKDDINIEVTKSLWIAMAEVKPLKNSCLV